MTVLPDLRRPFCCGRPGFMQKNGLLTCRSVSALELLVCMGKEGREE